jgi:Putative adhesin
MRRLALFAVLVLSFTAAARADEWSKTYTLQGKPDLRVETSDASIRVDTWDQNTIEARVTTEKWKIGEGGVKIIEHQTGETVELEVRNPHETCIVCIHVNGRDHHTEVVIHMPKEGRVNLRAGDGSIQLSNFKGAMDLQSGDGHEEIISVDGSLHAHSGDGHIRAEGRFDNLDLRTSDGHIDARVLPGSTMASGWDLHTGDGSVTLEVPADFAADVELHTGDGHISLDLPVTVEGQLSHNNIRGKLNGGGSLLTIHTGDGSIRLQKS